MTTRLLLSIAIAAAFTAGCGGLAESGDAGNGGQCISYLRLGGETYFPVPAEDLPLSDKTMTGEQPKCNDRGFLDVPPAAIEVNILNGVDPGVALGQPAETVTEAEMVWIAIGDTSEHDIPKELRKFLKP